MSETAFPGPDDVPDPVIAADHALSAMEWREVEAAGADFAMELLVTPRVTNSSGALQGGLLVTLTDIVAGRALLESDLGYERVTTSELHVNFLEASRKGPVRAEARILRAGHRSAVVRVDVFDTSQDDRQVASATLSFVSKRS